uniref:Uncharacterized protein n=1 Tax=Arundo donax TaxID=35708 RepID=A0A0A8YHC0_ARUDO
MAPRAVRRRWCMSGASSRFIEHPLRRADELQIHRASTSTGRRAPDPTSIHFGRPDPCGRRWICHSPRWIRAGEGGICVGDDDGDAVSSIEP